MTSTSDTPLAVAATAQSLAAEAFSLQSRIADLRERLALLNLQMQAVSDTLHRLRAVGSGEAPLGGPDVTGKAVAPCSTRFQASAKCAGSGSARHIEQV
ncbi:MULTISPECIES: hypothetical protein [unclassified Streptomyces]|uniref:hypothetical protein n=1 Tax=unclassified Streptomyces TaxID=2593676 RepID=UPI002DD9BAB7|nr:hypothetical protein [Streptomyces sp. NBC_01237]WRZ78242.1 hypothetical protein OG251_42520 [Streptomyces sp. NBC_01237]